jgi:hypothetical protein
MMNPWPIDYWFVPYDGVEGYTTAAPFVHSPVATAMMRYLLRLNQRKAQVAGSDGFARPIPPPDVTPVITFALGSRLGFAG